MITISYHAALNKAAVLAPSASIPTEFIKWAEDICELLSSIYMCNYEDVTEDLYDKVKEAQGLEDE